LPDPEATDQADVLEGLLAIMHMSRSLERVDAGLSPQQYRILKLAGAGGERSARLAERLAVAKPTLTSIADSVVAAGLARREAEPGDRRVVRLHLTEAGSAAVARADEAYGQWLTGLLEMTGADEQILADLRLIDAALVEQRRARKAAACARPANPSFQTGSSDPVTSTTTAGRA
jgi:DNA-binding MarR family transcriptional regulator